MSGDDQPDAGPGGAAAADAPATIGAAPPLFVVFNLASGHGDPALARAEIERACRDAGRPLQLLIVDQPGRIAEVARHAVELAGAAGGVVVAAGGDGTLNAVAQAALASGCSFGVLPQGTFNYFGRSHGIPSDTALAMRLLLTESPRPVQVGLVNDRVFLVNASVGLYPRLLEDREAWKRQFGRSRLVALGAGLMSLLRGHRSLRLRFDLDGHSQRVRTPTLFVGNNALQMVQIGSGLESQIDAGCLGAIMLRPVGTLAMLALLLRGALGQLGQADQVVRFAFKALTVGPSRTLAARRMIKVATDGEISRLALPLVFRVSPQPLMLVRPPVVALAPDEAAAPAPDVAATARPA